MMMGSGRPLAMHTRVTLLPSFTVMSAEMLEIFGGTVKSEHKYGKRGLAMPMLTMQKYEMCLSDNLYGNARTSIGPASYCSAK